MPIFKNLYKGHEEVWDKNFYQNTLIDFETSQFVIFFDPIRFSGHLIDSWKWVILGIFRGGPPSKTSIFGHVLLISPDIYSSMIPVRKVDTLFVQKSSTKDIK